MRRVAAVVEDHVGQDRLPSGIAGPAASARRTTNTPPATRPSSANTGTPCGSSTVPCGPTDDRGGGVVLVEKMLQRRPADLGAEATSVSMRTAVCTVVCSEPEIARPLSGSTSANSRRSSMSAGRSSCSAEFRSPCARQPGSGSATRSRFRCGDQRSAASWTQGSSTLARISRGTQWVPDRRSGYRVARLGVPCGHLAALAARPSVALAVREITPHPDHHHDRRIPGPAPTG